MLSSLMDRIGMDLDVAARTLMRGGLVAIPTETVYGLAANALADDAVLRIFAAKARPAFDPLIVHVASPDMFETLATRVPKAVLALAAAFCPGPLTFVLPKRPHVPDLTTSGLPTVALRVPDHPLTRALLARLPFPLAAPSANRFGYVSPTCADHVVSGLGEGVDYVLDGGPCRVGVESTIVDASAESLRILRPGGIPTDAIAKVVGDAVPIVTSVVGPVASPGMLASHYAPRATVILGSPPLLLERFGREGSAAITFRHRVSSLPSDRSIVLSPAGRLDVAARKLFGALRALDRPEIQRIFVELVPDHGLGLAINDRLRRAAS